MVVVVAIVMAALRLLLGGRRDGCGDRAGRAGPARRRAAVGSCCSGLRALFFLLPLLAMLEFTTRAGTGGGRTLDLVADLLVDATRRSARARSSRRCCLALLTAVLHARAAGADHDLGAAAAAAGCAALVEFLCLLPLTIPAIVIVVGSRTSTPG